MRNIKWPFVIDTTGDLLSEGFTVGLYLCGGIALLLLLSSVAPSLELIAGIRPTLELLCARLHLDLDTLALLALSPAGMGIVRCMTAWAEQQEEEECKSCWQSVSASESSSELPSG